MTPTTLAEAMNIPLARAAKWADPLTKAMARYGIDTPERQAAFIAQVGHESGYLVYVRELWGPTTAQAKYEGRKDLGNTQTGDGFKFRGRGLIQVTGRANYTSAGRALNLDLINHPELLEDPTNAARSAAWFWQTHGCNALADSGDFVALTRRINGGVNGLADRQVLWESAKAAFGVKP